MPSKLTLRRKDLLKKLFVKAPLIKGPCHFFSLESFFQVSRRKIRSDNWISKKNLTTNIWYPVSLNLFFLCYNFTVFFCFCCYFFMMTYVKIKFIEDKNSDSIFIRLHYSTLLPSQHFLKMPISYKYLIIKSSN